MKRKTITFSREIYDALRRFSDSDRLAIYDSLLDAMFNGSPPSKQLTDTQFMAYTVFAPQLRLIQMRYENGKKGGRPTESAQLQHQGIIMPNKKTENKPKHNRNITENSGINNNPCLNINNNNIYNTPYQSINHTREIARDTEKINFYHGLVTDKLCELLKSTDSEGIINRMQELTDRVASQAEPFFINLQEVPPEVVLQRLLEYFRMSNNEIISKLANVFYEIDSAKNITNRFKYAVTVFYNSAFDL